jgi:hypothetical protein
MPGYFAVNAWQLSPVAMEIRFSQELNVRCNPLQEITGLLALPAVGVYSGLRLNVIRSMYSGNIMCSVHSIHSTSANCFN